MASTTAKTCVHAADGIVSAARPCVAENPANVAKNGTTESRRLIARFLADMIRIPAREFHGADERGHDRQNGEAMRNVRHV